MRRDEAGIPAYVNNPPLCKEDKEIFSLKLKKTFPLYIHKLPQIRKQNISKWGS
jgi:hypothetical protein